MLRGCPVSEFVSYKPPKAGLRPRPRLPAAATPPTWVLFVVFRGEILGLFLLLRRTSIFCCVTWRREGICGSRRLLLPLGFQALVPTLEASPRTQLSAGLRVQGWAQRSEPRECGLHSFGGFRRVLSGSELGAGSAPPIIEQRLSEERGKNPRSLVRLLSCGSD